MIPLVDLKSFLRVDGDADDRLLVELERSAVAAVQTWTGRHFGPVEPRVEARFGEGLVDLWLAEPPAAGTLSATASVLFGATTAVDLDGVVVVGRRLIRREPWSEGVLYTINYRAGFEAGREPADVRQAVKATVAAWYAVREAGELPAEVRRDLAAYKRVRV
jgi:hypothetical protein